MSSNHCFKCYYGPGPFFPSQNRQYTSPPVKTSFTPCLYPPVPFSLPRPPTSQSRPLPPESPAPPPRTASRTPSTPPRPPLRTTPAPVSIAPPVRPASSDSQPGARRTRSVHAGRRACRRRVGLGGRGDGVWRRGRRRWRRGDWRARVCDGTWCRGCEARGGGLGVRGARCALLGGWRGSWLA